MNSLTRMVWWLRGEAAKVIVEDYDSPSDAIIDSIGMALMTAALTAGGQYVFEAGTHWVFTAGAVAIWLFAFAAGLYALIHVIASVTYAVEPTAEPLIRRDEPE